MASAQPPTAEADGRFGTMWPRNPGASLALPFSVRFRRLHLRTFAEPQIVAPHLHDDLELLLLQTGTWHGSVNGEALQVPAGGALLVAPGDRHEDRCRRPLTLCGIALELLPGPRRGRSATPLAAGVPVAVRRLAKAPVLHRIAQRLTDVTCAGGRWSAPRQDAIAHELLVELLAMLPESALAPAVAERLAAAGFGAALAAVLDAHPSGLSVPALARALNLGERTLQMRCRYLLGATPLVLVRRQRLQVARELLTTGATVQAVADHLGYANPFHFSTAYKQAFGHPPSRTLRKSEGRQLPRTWPEGVDPADSVE